MLTKIFVEEIKHTVTWFGNVYGQYDDLFFSVRGFGHPVFPFWTPCHENAAGGWFSQYKMMQKYF